MLRFGNIHELNPEKGTCRVFFKDIDLVTAPLFVLVKNTKENKDEFTFSIGEHVACLMDENNESGVILGSTYTSKDKPKVGKKSIRRTSFSDGSFIEFNTETKKFKASFEGYIEILKASGVVINSNVEIKGKLEVRDGIDCITGNIEAKSGDVKATVFGLSTHTHGYVSPTGPAITPPPNPG